MAGKIATVFGATGTAGGGVMRHLIGAGWQVRAVTTNPAGDKARRAEAAGATLIQADLNDRATIRRAIEGADMVYLSGPSLLNRWDIGQAAQGIAVVDSVVEAGTPHLIYQSALVAGARGVLSVGSKRAIEERIAELELTATITRPGVFMENLINYFPMKEEHGTLIFAMAVPVEKEQGLIAAGDIGRAAAVIAADPKRYAGAEIDLVSDVQTFGEMARIIGAAAGKPCTPVSVPLEALAANWPEGFGLYRWLSSRTETDSNTQLIELVGKPTSFADWVRSTLLPTL